MALKKGQNRKRAAPPVRKTSPRPDDTRRRDGEESFRDAFDKSVIGKSITQPDGSIRINKAFADLLGYSAPELQGKNWRDYTHPDDVAETQRNVDLLLSGKTDSVRFVKRFVHKDGRTIWTDVGSTVRRDKKGKPLYLITDLIDLTERKQAEEALRESESRFRAIAAHTPDHILIQDRDLRYRLVINPQLGLTEKDMIGKTDYDFLSAEDAEKLTAVKRRVIETGAPVHLETSVLNLKGINEFFEGDFIPRTDAAGQVDGLFGYFHNVTARNRAEDILRANEIRLSLIHDNVYDAVFTIQVEPPDHFRFGSINRRFRELTGLSENQVVGKLVQEVIPEPAQALVLGKYREAIQKGRPVHWEEVSVYPAGTKVGAVTMAPIVDAAGNCTQLIGTVHDITESKEAERSLRENEERLRDIIYSSADWIWEVDANGIYTFSSQKSLDLFGPDGENVLGRTPFNFMPPEEAKRIGAIFADIVARKAPIKDLENWNIGKGGRRICLLTNGVPILDGEGNLKGYRGVDKDITERKQVEEQMQQSLREKEILLREVHHRTKNNMNVIIALLSLRGENSGDATVVQTFKDIQDRIKAMALVHQKLYQSRDLSRIDMREYLADLSALLVKTAAGSNGRIAMEFDMIPLPLSIDTAIPLGLVVTELFSNVIKHALREDGEIRVRLRLARGGTGGIELTFSDDGIGVPAGFDFRARQTLGLQTIFMLVEHQLRGSVEFEGGRGISCRIRIPLPSEPDGNRT